MRPSFRRLSANPLQATGTNCRRDVDGIFIGRNPISGFPIPVIAAVQALSGHISLIVHPKNSAIFVAVVNWGSVPCSMAQRTAELTPHPASISRSVRFKPNRFSPSLHFQIIGRPFIPPTPLTRGFFFLDANSAGLRLSIVPLVGFVLTQHLLHHARSSHPPAHPSTYSTTHPPPPRPSP